MNFLLQKEDKSETKYASGTKEKKNGWFLIFAGNAFFHFQESRVRTGISFVNENETFSSNLSGCQPARSVVLKFCKDPVAVYESQ